MSYVFDVNNDSMTGAQAMYKFKELLKTAGWVVKSSGDGLSAFSSTTDIITSGSSGANGFANSNAWVRLQSPAGAGSREFLVQRSSFNTLWTIKYSYSIGFSAGSPSATVLPTATDSQTLLSASSLFVTDSTYRFNAAADNAAPYGFWMGCFLLGGESNFNPSGGAWMMDPLLTGSYPAADVDPTIHYVSGTTSWSSGTTSGIFGYLKKGLSGEGFVNIPWLIIQSQSASSFPQGVGNNCFTLKTDLFPIFYARQSSKTAPVGYKGISSICKWTGNPLACPTLLSVSTTNDYIVIGHIALPWNGSSILI
jgi:hypothetical protein